MKGEHHRTECRFKCQDGLFMHAYDSQGYPDYENHTSGYYICQQEEWEYMMEDGSSRKFQCLPPSDPAQDCDLNELKKKISGTPNPKLKECPRKFRKDGDYSFSGTKCTLQCPSSHSFWMQSFDKKLVKGPKTVDFTCQNSTWVSPTNVKSKHIQCIKNSASRLDCKNNIGMDLKNCLQNYRGGYFPGTKCNLECQENYSLYAYGNDSSLLFNSKAVLEPMNPKVEVTCKSKTSGTWHFKQPMWTFALDDGSKIHDKRFQCLPPSNSSRDCLKWPKWVYDIKLHRNLYGGNIVSGRFYCPINDRGTYSEGTKCTWQCDKGYVLYNKKLKTKNLPKETSSFHYTCENSQWDSSLSSEFQKGFLYCVK